MALSPFLSNTPLAARDLEPVRFLVVQTAVLIPVLGRPHTISPVLQSIGETTPSVRVVFIATVGDTGVFAALRDMAQANTPFDVLTMRRTASGDYARKINYAAANTDADVFFLGASDLRFHPGWLENGTRPFYGGKRIGVVGTNDLGNSRVMAGEHSTHSFVTRWYMEEFGLIDQPGKILYEGYAHEFVDDELVGTAKHRDMYVWAGDSIVEHLHPQWGKAEPDAMYQKARIRMRASRNLFNRRRKMWT
jgi:hypothetical protein